MRAATKRRTVVRAKPFAARATRPRRDGADPAALFAQMARIRAFEEALASLWHRGLISGEMHLGIGEEAVIAGVVGQLRDGDAIAVDHRSTPPLVARGVDLESLVLEMLGHEDGICHGRGGHMHLFAPELLVASSGIVGSAGPLASGFALAATRLRPGSVAVGLFGDGAANQGMLLESLNLASAWRLPVVFVCKDNGWAITTRSRRVTGGDLVARAGSFGMPAWRVDGTRVEAVARVAGRALARARAGHGPSFVLARCPRTTGHFLGDPLLAIVDHPARELRELAGPLRSAMRATPGAPAGRRAAAMRRMTSTLTVAALERHVRRRDPLRRARRLIPAMTAEALEHRATDEVASAVAAALARVEAGDA